MGNNILKLVAAVRISLVLFLMAASVVSVSAQTLSGRVQVWLDHDYQKDGTISTTRDQAQIRADQEYSDGTGTETAVIDRLWYSQRQLASATSEEIDLAGWITDAFGSTISFARVKALFIRNTSTSQTLTIGNATAPWAGPFSPATATFSIPPSGFAAWQAPLVGWPVTATTGDRLKIANDAGSGATCTYDIWVVGGSL
jgi:hypothetical protein